MKRLIWIIVVAILLLATVLIFIFGSKISANEADLSEYLVYEKEQNYFYNQNCITDPNVAAKIGNAILDDICRNSPLDIGSTTVYYDSTNELWKVSRGYLFHPGGFVIIRASDGAVVRSLLYKN